MHPKLLERREAVTARQLNQVDLDIRSACLPLACRVRLAGIMCLGKDEAKNLEWQFQMSVNYVVEIPINSETGLRARRELLGKLIQLEEYLETLLCNTWTQTEAGYSCWQDLKRCAQTLDDMRIEVMGRC